MTILLTAYVFVTLFLMLGFAGWELLMRIERGEARAHLRGGYREEDYERATS